MSSSIKTNRTPHRIIKTIWLPDIEWIEIPAGDFRYGEEKQTQYLDRFNISQYPITNSQYQTFVDDGGYEDKRWWENLEVTRFKESKWSQANRPKTDVNWYEAVAFTRWLSKRLGYEITLPMEQQWEKAARGVKGNEYSWGEFKAGFANLNDKSEGGEYLRQTTAVGVYPHGNTVATNISDMSGNVVEWCLNKYDKPEMTDVDTSGDSRVLRGGSSIDYPEFARASGRYGFDPGNRDDYWGFRVVCVLPFTEH